MSGDLMSLSEEKTVLLTTFRRNGDAVGTPVWIARADGALVVTTGSSTGKVKRIRNNPRVELRPCTRSGKVAEDAPLVLATAEVTEQDGVALDAIRSKYGLTFGLLITLERVLRRRRSADRVILRLTPVSAT